MRGTSVEVAVVGAGFGGLGAALRLSERGARVVLLESLSYPGGCASTFERGGARFEAGATLFSGLGEGGLFRRWIDRYGLDVEVEWPDPVVEWRTPDLVLPVHRERGDLERRLAALPGAPVAGLRRFFAHQRRVADALWELLDDPSLLPPFDAGALLRHVLRAGRLLPMLRDVGRPLAVVLERHGVADFAPLRRFVDALCQITVQCPAAEAEAAFALATLDYYWRGTGHVRGGIGRLAHGLVEAIRSAGGEVRLASRVSRIARVDGTWVLDTRGGPVRAERVVANVLPQSLDALLPEDLPRSPRLARLAREVERGWGACMLYLLLESQEREAPRHLQLVSDPSAPLIEGNHVFCSLNGEGTATVSTHVPMDVLDALLPGERGSYVARVQERMRASLRALAPEVCARVAREHTASPRTFARFTGRFAGYVGGVPRRAGLRQYVSLAGSEVAPGLSLVGDTVFPGQSTLATAIGGWKAAERASVRRPRTLRPA